MSRRAMSCEHLATLAHLDARVGFAAGASYLFMSV